jgi:hypothetical protein
MEWQDARGQAFDQLNALLEDILSGVAVEMPQECPACSPPKPDLHAYFHARLNRPGGVWLWCSSCKMYLHGSVKAPVWWSNLDSLSQDQLTARPQYLDEHAMEIDMHWNRLVNKFS